HTYAFALAPHRVEGLPPGGVAQVSAGWQTTCALTCGGEVYCWGANSGGVLGMKDPPTTSSPTLVQGLGKDVVEVHTGGGPACARKSDGSVWCWGETTYGNTGVEPPQNGSYPSPIVAPTKVDAVHDAVELAVSDTVGCVRDKDGGVSCW